MGRTHLVSGAAAGAWLAVGMTPAATLPPMHPFVGFVLALTLHVAGVTLGAGAAMLPDWDHPSARVVRVVPLLGPVLCHVIRFLSKMTTGVEHRGLSHSLLFSGLWAWLVYLASAWLIGDTAARYLALAVVVGHAAALAGDLVTRAGLRHVLWPLPIELSIPRLLRIKTDGPFEKWIVFPLTLALAVAGVAEWLGLVSWTVSWGTEVISGGW
jgi:inner membrane protein